MGTTRDSRVVREATAFVRELETGVPITDALCGLYGGVDRPDIVAAATEMLATEGTIDMKLLAKRVGMSRASLYRYYADRTQLESAIAAKACEEIVVAAAAQPDRASKLRVTGEYLLDNPGAAAAMVPLASTVSVDVLQATCEFISGHAADTAWIIGMAVMAATPGRDDREVEQLRAYIDQNGEQFV